MKKILPILTILSLPVALCACNDDHEKANTSFDAYQHNIANFQNYFKEYSTASDSQLNKLVLNKYRLNLTLPEDAKLVNGLANEQPKTDTKQTTEQSNNNNANQAKIVPNTANQTNTSEANTETPALDEQQPTTLPDNSQDRPIVDSPTVQPAKILVDTNNVNVDALNDTTNQDNINNNNTTDSNSTNNSTTITDKNADKTKTTTDNGSSGTTTNTNKTTNTNISTLYSLTADVDEQCNQFCELKKQLNNAIIETQNLIDKVNNNEIELTNEQCMFLTEQSSQLKALGKRLTTATTELSFSVSDLGKIINTGGSYDQLAMKYLLVLDNLYNGNDMLENGIYQLNMINQLMNMSAPVPGNNIGRILYGFRQNNNAPIIYDYLIDKDGNLTQNQTNNADTDSNKTTNNNQTSEQSGKNQNDEHITKDIIKDNDETKSNNSTKRPRLTPNIDTYGNYKSNIDTFFNTALLNRYGMNGFNNGYGYGGYGGYGGAFGGLNGFGNPMQNANGLYAGNGFGNAYNPYMAYNNLNKNNYYAAPDNVLTNATDGVQNQLNTQDNQTAQNKVIKPKFKFTKNIDTYRDANTPTPKQRFAKIKSSVNSFFSKFKKPNKDDIKNPVYRLEPGEETTTNES